MLNILDTYELLKDRTHAKSDMTKYCTQFPFEYGAANLCPLTHCNRAFTKALEAGGILDHLTKDHWITGAVETCRKHSDIQLRSLKDWNSHHKGYHKYLLCFGLSGPPPERNETPSECIDAENTTGFTRGHASGILYSRGRGAATADHKRNSGHTSIQSYDGIKLLFTSAKSVVNLTYRKRTLTM